MPVRKQTPVKVYRRSLVGYKDGRPVYHFERAFNVSRASTLEEAAKIVCPKWETHRVPEDLYMQFVGSTRYYSLFRVVQTMLDKRIQSEVNNTSDTTDIDLSVLDGL